MAGEIAAHGDFGAVDPVYPRIAPRPAAQDLDFQTGNETQVHQMFGNRRSQLKVGKDGAFADAQISQSAGQG